MTGLLNKQIGAQLGIAENTVRVHRAHMMEKMGVSSVAELVRAVAEFERPSAARRPGCDRMTRMYCCNPALKPSWTPAARRIPAAVLAVLWAGLSAITTASGALSQSSPSRLLEQSTPHFALKRDGGGIISLRFDAAGQGRHGPETIASGGSLGGFETATLNNDILILSGPDGEMHWDLPFERTGYYDADLHLNYPSPSEAAGASPLVLPFRRFVTSAGQYVNIEHFKRLPLGPWTHAFNTAEGSHLLLVGDNQLNCDVKLTCPGQSLIQCEVGEKQLRLKVRMTSRPITIQVLPPGSEVPPGGAIVLPSVRFKPDFQVTCDLTNKRVAASVLMTDLVRTAIYWHPSMTVVGDWGLGAVETHLMDDPRSWYLKHLRAELLKMIAWIGYDRFEHFGMMFAWGRFPDYGAGSLLNLPPANAPYDMRMLHLNGQWIETVSRYVLATGDTDLLRSRRARWLATDGDEPQPICGKNATCADYVLAAGDVRLDGRKPRRVHTLSQAFLAHEPFTRLRLRLGTESRTEPARGWMELRQGKGSEVVVRRPFEVRPGLAQPLEFVLPRELPAGTYRVEIGDDDSGSRYFGPGLYWLTDPDSHEAAPPAGSGPFAGTFYDRLVLLFDYILENTGAGSEHLFCYINDPEFNIPDHKSGRAKVCTENSYWEAAGGGYDAFEGLWYNAACRAMAEMAALMNDPASAERYRRRAEQADLAYNEKYWHTTNDNERAFSRYHACEDWDGRIHDFGYTYYNLEAICRKIASPDQARAVLWWLDRGQWSPDGGKTWKDDIYAIWGFAPPFNTIANHTWLNVTGTLPYREVLANGGTRPNIAGRDVLARSRYLDVDNMHERNRRILSRFASPDRLTGGRTVNDPGGRGRWHFGPPHIDRADVEGFREIFPQNGDVVTYQIMAYLGLDYASDGLWLRPRVPSDLAGMSFGGIGYAGASFNFDIEAQREEVPIETIGTGDAFGVGFRSEGRFNKVGMRMAVRPFDVRLNHQLVLTLERKSGAGWRSAVQTWRNHVQDEQWIWTVAEEWLPPGEYRLRVSETASPTGQTMRPAGEDGPPVIRCVAERTQFAVRIERVPQHTRFRLEGGSVEADGTSRMKIILEPGQRARLAGQ